MSPRFLIALMLAAVPLAYAHDVPASPKNYCEDPSEWQTHDYVTGTSLAIFFAQDGNLAGDCDGDTVPADYDGHLEFAIGGAFLSADSGDGVTGGTIVCFGEVGHHPAFGPIIVNDTVFGRTMPFLVASDIGNVVPPTDPSVPNCGDFETDVGTGCLTACVVTFPPGLDGTYTVYVGDFSSGSIGTGGHVTTGGSFMGAPEEETPGSRIGASGGSPWSNARTHGQT